ncbi:MAG: tetratricopeptide repeat protein, partial [Bacteroidota bacterium]
MRTIALFFFLSLLADTASAQVIMSSKKKAAKLFESGKKLQKARDFFGAIEKYNEAIGRDSSFAEAYLQAGAAYITLLQTEKAVVYYKELADRYPDSPRYVGAHLRLAEYYFSGGSYSESLIHSERYLSFIDEKNINYQKTFTIHENSRFALDRIDDPLNFNPQPLEAPINKFKQQYFPVLTADQKTLFFIKRDKDEEIYFSEREKEAWSVPMPIDSSLTSEYNEGTCTVSADGRTMVFTSCMRKDGYGSCDLYISKKIGDKWTTPQNLGRPINSSAWDSQPALSADGMTLFYVSNRKGGLG